MRESIGWGLVTGLVSSAAAWLSERLTSSEPVSLFPDLLSLIIFVAVAAFALRRVLRDATSVTVAMKRGLELGASAGAVIALATLLRLWMGWSSPDAMLGAVTVVASFVTVVAVVAVLARATHALRSNGLERHV